MKRLKKENGKKPMIDQLEMSINKGILSIKGAEYKKLIEVPTDETLLKSKKSERDRWNKIKLVP